MCKTVEWTTCSWNVHHHHHDFSVWLPVGHGAEAGTLKDEKINTWTGSSLKWKILFEIRNVHKNDANFLPWHRLRAVSLLLGNPWRGTQNKCGCERGMRGLSTSVLARAIIVAASLVASCHARTQRCFLCSFRGISSKIENCPQSNLGKTSYEIWNNMRSVHTYKHSFNPQN